MDKFLQTKYQIDDIMVAVFMLAMLTTKNCRARSIKCTRLHFRRFSDNFFFVFHLGKRNPTYTYVSALFPLVSFALSCCARF